MRAEPPAASPLRIGTAGRYVLEPAEHRLLVDGQPAALGRRALDLLVALTRRPGHLFGKHELLDLVWPGLVVEEANLQMQVANLRKVLGADAIATVPGRGYRFAAPVAPVGSVAPAEARAASHPVGVASAGPAATATPTSPASAGRHAGSGRAGSHRGLFGRAADLAGLERLLQPGARITLVGPAGVGKTRLARVVAERSHDAVWVDLASLSRGDDLVTAVARAMGTSLAEGDATPQLLRALRGKALLLVLDNAEHLIDACAELVARLAALTELRLLVTSQLPLVVASERMHRLEPLALPGADGAPLDGDASGLADGALALLVERIGAVDHRFEASAAAMPALRAICTRLDGLPLALEMAAARVPLLGLQGVHDALEQRFALLTRGHRDSAPRHRTLHHALDWSYQLLDPAEQHLFRALGVFAGGFTLELVVALMSEGTGSRWATIDALGSLADRSLVVVGTEDPPRYRLLETMRAFALERLREAAAPADDERSVRQRHAAAMLSLFTRYQPDEATAKAQCEAEMENLREAIVWAQANDLALAAQLTALAAPVANFTVWRQESTRWLRALEPAMRQAAGQALPKPVQAAWWTEFARAASIRRDPRAAPAAQHALALWDQVGDARRALLAAAVCVRSVYAPGPELDRACAELQSRADNMPEATVRERLQVRGALVAAATERVDLPAILDGRLAEMALAAQLGLQAMADAAESNVVFVLNAMGRYAEAVARGGALLARIDAGSDNLKGNLPWVLQGLLIALVGIGRLDEAHRLVPRAWAACAHFGFPAVAPTVALLAALQWRFEAAALLVGHANAAFAAREMQMSSTNQDRIAQARGLAEDALGAAETTALLEQGRALGDAAAAALAAAQPDNDRNNGKKTQGA